jgi:phosphoketolase
VIQAAQQIASRRPAVSGQAEAMVRRYEQKLLEHSAHIRSNAVDLPEVTGWSWRRR